MANFHLNVQYIRSGVTDRLFTVGFDFSTNTTIDFGLVGERVSRGVATMATNITKVLGFEWSDVIVRNAKRFSNKTKTLVPYFYASTGQRRFQFNFATPIDGIVATSGDNAALGVGVMYAQLDNGTGKEGKFMLRGGMTEGLLGTTNLSSWGIPKVISDAVLAVIDAAGYIGPYLANGSSPIKMVNNHVSKTGLITTNPVTSIVAKRISKYRSVQPGIS